MNKDKLIEEMALDIMNVSTLPLELSGALAIDLYEKGYHKASDVAREIFAEIEKEVEMQDSLLIDENLIYLPAKIAELKKKYESEEK